MDRSRRVAQLWNWLPAFRVVAETEHLPTASSQHNLSASALSRSVKLLEDELGEPLFVRTGRQLVLSSAGEHLLSAVRDAMARIEEGVTMATSTAHSGPVQISAPGPFASIFVLPALENLRASHPDILPHLVAIDPRTANRMLLDGSLDLAVLDAPVPCDELDVLRLGRLTFSIYAGAGHPLAGRLDVTLDEALAYPFVGPPPGLLDHWPPELRRELGMVVSQMQVAVHACAAGGLLAFLPDAIATVHAEPPLTRLPLEVIEPRALYAVCRPTKSESSRVEVVLEAIGEVVRARERGPMSDARELAG